ncbi:hypothetical protein EUGRSUZ_A00734 [Eucalyptus grandis]|uniref:non-specific serine/threonine protein kinase n=2 Tax=Eucalyptus grandis TaxID=71139 RepID=A0A059DDN3_EUCGR|nr:hypothetical protein EUGRSUZ_A00734 [Eucalyptus grandis]
MSTAVKMINREKFLKVGMNDQIKREILVMTLIRHPHPDVVELYEVMATKTKIYFVMQYAKGAGGVCHRHLKPKTLLLDENGNLKVSDFGLSALAKSKRLDGLLHTTCRTPTYVAPEVINRRGYDGSKADIWSCGVILFVLLAGYFPFHDSNLMEMCRKIGKGEFKFPKLILDPNPNTRISMTKIMESSWFRKGVDSKTICIVREVKESPSLNEPSRLSNLNAFDIISYPARFDLSGLFEGVDQRKEVWFTVNKPRLRLKVKNKDGGLMKFKGTKVGRQGVLSFDAEIFEITPAFHLVEMKKPSGDTMEYHKGIVWTWQGEQSPPPPPPPPPLPNQQLVEQEESHPFYDSTLPVTSSLD